MKLHVAAALFFGAQSSASASDTGVLLVNGSIKKRHLATNETETSSRREQRQERLEKFREKLAEGKGKFHHGGNYTNGRINNVTLAQVVQPSPSFAKEEEEDPLFGCPQEDIVVCVNGMSGSGAGAETCQDACGGDCCVGPSDSDACTGFTGRVCKDGLSCTGGDACKNADIDLVVGGCRGDLDGDGPVGVCEYADIKRGVIRGCIGDGSCFEAGVGDGGGYVGRIKDGCVGDGACRFLGYSGYVGFVDNGCVEEDSCRNTGKNGRVGFIRNACKGGGSCDFAGAFGFVGFIENSCTGIFACDDAGRGANYAGSGIGSIEHSCHDDFACVQAGYFGTISSIKWSCKGESACANAASEGSSGTGGYIDGINKACLGDRACFAAAKYGGFINGISKACLTDSSCFYAARDYASIDSGIKNCVCDTCAGALDDASLPDECGDKLDFGELFDELNDIIKSKIDP